MTPPLTTTLDEALEYLREARRIVPRSPSDPAIFVMPWHLRAYLLSLVEGVAQPAPPAEARSLRQACYDGLPTDADDDLYAVADGIYESVRRYLAATEEGPVCGLLGPHEHDGVSTTGPCWRNPMYAGPNDG